MVQPPEHNLERRREAVRVARSAGLVSNLNDGQLAMVEGMILGYEQCYGATRADWEVLAIELPFCVSLGVLDGEAWWYAGKADLVARDPDGFLVVMDHKTASGSIAPGSSFWSRAQFDRQTLRYAWALRQVGYPVEHAWYDVISKPALRQRNKESDAEFGIRCAAWYVEEPETAYQRMRLPLTEDRLLAVETELRETARRIRQVRDGYARQNDRSCFAYGRPCDFWDVCSAGADPSALGMWQPNSTHDELPTNPEDPRGRNTLTHSRIGCFDTCERKHTHRYEEGWTYPWVRQADALRLGDALHRGLESWWKSAAAGDDGA